MAAARLQLVYFKMVHYDVPLAILWTCPPVFLVLSIILVLVIVLGEFSF